MALTVNTNIINDTNQYLLDAKNVKGTFVVVASTAERDALPAATTVNGSLCYCTADSKFYQYNGSSWQEKEFGTNATNDAYNLGYYDTITENSDGTYTITRKTGFRNISIDLIKNGAYRPTQAGHGEYGADTGIHNLPIAAGSKNFINNLLTVRDSGEIYSGSTGISITENGMCWVNLGDNYTTTEQYREYFAKNNVYVQYKLATARTEKVEERHYARYNQSFILEHNKSEAEKSLNLLNPSWINSEYAIYNPSDNSYSLSANGYGKIYENLDSKITNKGYYVLSFMLKSVLSGKEPYIVVKYIDTDGNMAYKTSNNATTNYIEYKLDFYGIPKEIYLTYGNISGDAVIKDIMLNEGSTALPYQPYNQNKHITNNEALLLKNEAEKSANVFNKDLPTLIYGTGYEVPTTVNDWVKVYQVPVKGNTVYSSNKEMTVYASSDGVTYTGIGAGVTTFTTSSNTKYLCFCIYVGTNNATISSSRQTFSDLMLNEGPVALPYQPYEGKVIHEKDLKNASTNLGYYDTITENVDGTYTITKQTGYVTINAEDITSGSNESVNSANAYTYVYYNNKISDALYDWDAIIGISNNGFEVKCVDSSWTGANKISINSIANQICLGFVTAKTQAEIQALCPIYVQYKLATATTEKVEKNHYARYNKRFILEHNKIEAEKSSNLWSYENGITISAGNESWWTLSNATMDAWGLVVGETYSIKSFVNNSTKDLAFQLLPGWSDFKNGRTFVFTNDTQIRIGGNTVASTVTFIPKITLVKGIDIADEYQPYYGKPVHKKEFEDLKNSMKFIPYVSVVETTSSKDISENGTYFVIPTEPASASLKLQVKAGPRGTLQTAYFSGGIISVFSFYDSKFQTCGVKITYGAGSSLGSIEIADSYSPAGSSSGVISRITGKCKIYKLI